jgi:hypothetical protein
MPHSRSRPGMMATAGEQQVSYHRQAATKAPWGRRTGMAKASSVLCAGVKHGAIGQRCDWMSTNCPPY